MNTFNQQKLHQLSKSDKSNEGGWDLKIKPLCNKINKSKDYYTTSSCAGRIILIKQTDKKQPDAFLFKTHKKTTLNEINQALNQTTHPDIDFQQTCCILHVACSSPEKAFQLVTQANLSGWKRSGVISHKRNIVELHSTENLSFPIKVNNKVLVSDEFLKIAIEQANKKLERTWNKIIRLKNSL